MVVEHTFITTLPEPDALRMAWELLHSRGFTPLPAAELAARPPASNAVELRRGRPNPDRARSIVELPQFVRVEWDRGRVVVAASITPRTWMNRQYTPGTIMTKPINARQPDQENLLMAVIWALEQLLAHRRPPAECVAGLDQLQAQLIDKARRGRRKGWLIVGGIVLAFVAFIVFAAKTFK